jgi:hypothetical protein
MDFVWYFSEVVLSAGFALARTLPTTPPPTRGVNVHDNTVTLRAAEAGVGAVASEDLVGLFGPEANNRGQLLPGDRPGAAYSSWNGEMLTWNQWHTLGHDVNGTVESIARASIGGATA